MPTTKLFEALEFLNRLEMDHLKNIFKKPEKHKSVAK